MTWSDDEAALEHAIERLQKRYLGENVELITAFDIAYVGWEFDCQGALIRHGGVPELVIVDQTSGDERPVREILESKLEEYERLAAETKHVLAQHMVLEGLREFATEPPLPGDEMPDGLALQRKPGESDDEYAERNKLFEDLQKAGGRIAIGIEELPESVIERLRKQAVEFPDAEIEIVGGDGTGNLVSDLGLPASTGTLWALVRGLRAMIAGSAMTPAKFARDAGLTEQEVQDLFDGRIGNAVLERVIDIYDVAARRSGKRTVAEMIEKDDA